MARPYTCAACGGTFESSEDWTEEDMRAEFEAVFTEEERKTGGAEESVCDDCYRAMMAAEAAVMAGRDA